MEFAHHTSHTWDNFLWVFSGIALAFSADAVSPVVAESCGSVVRPAAGLEVTVKAEVFGVTLTRPTKVVWCALANSTHVRAVVRALCCVLDVPLEWETHYLYDYMKKYPLSLSWLINQFCVLMISPYTNMHANDKGWIDRILTGFPGFSQSHWHIISKLTKTFSLIPTGYISKVCFHSRGSFGHFTTSILATT